MKKRTRPITFGQLRVDTPSAQRQNLSEQSLSSGAIGASGSTDATKQNSVGGTQGVKDGSSRAESEVLAIRDKAARMAETGAPVVVAARAPVQGTPAAPLATVQAAPAPVRQVRPAVQSTPQPTVQSKILNPHILPPRTEQQLPLPPRPATPRNLAPTYQKTQIMAVEQAPPPEAFKLETKYLDEPHHHRWLMTSCIAGVVGSLLIGGLALDLFGHNAAPVEAIAAVPKKELTNAPKPKPLAAQQAAEELPGTKSPEVKTAEIIPERSLENSYSYPEITEDQLPYDDAEASAGLDTEIADVDASEDNITTISKSPPPEPVDQTFRVTKMGGLRQELLNRGVTKSAADAVIAAINPIMPTAMIKPGTAVEVTLDRQQDFYGREAIVPVELSFKPGPKETVVVEANEDGGFDARIDGKRDGAKSQYAEIRHLRARARIGSSLYGTAKDNLIPDYIVSEFTRVFSYDVDFQRQVSASDSFELFFGAPLSGTSSKRKVLHYAELTYDGKTKTYYRFTAADGQTDYYDENGRSASRALLKTPISGARLTSGFGMRRHPLLGYSRMHTGTDFGAPSGTPIRAAGSGVIDLAGRHGAYGNTIVLKHTTKHKTLYAHMSKFAAGIRSGLRINQGQIIGYVGSTGRSTGPHLHYEVRVNGRPVNPTAIKAAGGKQLAGADLRRFREIKSKVAAMMQQAPSSIQVAQAQQ
jgi:murein DD-endopeptidase MepM/ murein hydrolase activator NlpD